MVNMVAVIALYAWLTLCFLIDVALVKTSAVFVSLHSFPQDSNTMSKSRH